MPSSHQSSARTASQPSILLLEEYEALAAAIASALNKFAPKHTVSVARTLDEAQGLAAKIAPELFVIDVDPPWTGLTDFLERMRTTCPDARVLIIGAPIPAEIAAERGSSGALQFVEKPFELAAFGAAVQAVLGPWREPESATSRGRLRSLSLADVVLVHCAAGASVTVDVHTGTKDFGEIHVANGQIVHAKTRRLTGADALREMLSWPETRTSEQKSSGTAERTIQKDWSSVFLQVLRATEAMQPRQLPPETKAPPEIRPAKTGKKIVVVDDTEMLLIFVEDVLATAAPELQITTARDAGEGLKQIEHIIPDLVLLDYSLPDFNGDELCRQLLQDPWTAEVPVLMMSGHVPEMTAAAERFENIVATIEKPFLSEALVDLVQKTLEQKRPARAKAPLIPHEQISKAVTTVTAERKPEPAKMEAPPVQLSVRVAAAGKSEAVLGLFLEIVSMQLTPKLQMGAIRARPASLSASLQLSSPSAHSAVAAGIGFQLGATQLDSSGQISALRLVPNSKPFRPAEMRSAFQIGGVTVIPNETRARVQLTPAGTTPMTIELRANLELSAVELSPTFQVAQLILNWPAGPVRVTLDPKAPEQSAARFDVQVTKLDDSTRIAEVLLNPIR